MATALYKGHFCFVPSDRPYIESYIFKTLYNGNGHKSVSPTAKITSLQLPVSSVTGEKSQE